MPTKLKDGYIKALVDRAAKKLGLQSAAATDAKDPMGLRKTRGGKSQAAIEAAEALAEEGRGG